MEIVRAKPDDAQVLTNIVFAAKRHWNYPESWIDIWRDTLTLQPDFLANHETYCAILDDSVIGFYALDHQSGKLDLRHLWVLPDVMGKGVGRSLFVHALNRIQALGFRRLEIESDPNAEGFYERMGARRVGARITKVGGQRRELPILIYEILDKAAP